MIDKNFKKVVESIKNEIYKTQTLIMKDYQIYIFMLVKLLMKILLGVINLLKV